MTTLRKLWLGDVPKDEKNLSDYLKKSDAMEGH